MRALVDTQLLLWAAGKPERLSKDALALIESEESDLFFSLASLWEVAIKSGLGRPDFQTHPAVLRKGMIDSGYRELAIRTEHTVAVMSLPPMHKDPFDRLLIAQAAVEELTFLTADTLLSRYADHVAIRIV